MNVTRFLFFSFQHFLFYKFLQITVKLEDDNKEEIAFILQLAAYVLLSLTAKKLLLSVFGATD